MLLYDFKIIERGLAWLASCDGAHHEQPANIDGEIDFGRLHPIIMMSDSILLSCEWYVRGPCDANGFQDKPFLLVDIILRRRRALPKVRQSILDAKHCGPCHAMIDHFGEGMLYNLLPVCPVGI